MNKPSFFALSLALAGALVSCGDENADPQPASQTASGRLMAKTWMVTAATEKEGSKPARDIYTSQDACLKDNLFKFQASNAFVLDEGKTKCDNASPQSLTGKWALSNNDQTLLGTVTVSPAPGFTFDIDLTGTIEELTAAQLILVDAETDNGVTTVTRTTFTAQ
ncbi:hypothetical protein SAMN00120144_0056 [Hymenobacter roseosalivarius DSM 11622]|uniref:Lipocalin-like domain-containing protein n=1 Tax=Hymenobacter roseosalivarius DSM 11622 TaxID=645990 RepID=A0A1W1W0Q3_9BACT|nr:hypothetical protein [Hymenobacter roseosalivarius]SMB99185.1 hypothetical protein SAMN00120144_0056 [Hymenobacter roseosalivarius DSM 11622]